MVSLYKQKSNNNYMNVCVHCIEYKKEIDILSAKITCIEYDNDKKIKI